MTFMHTCTATDDLKTEMARLKELAAPILSITQNDSWNGSETRLG